ncbi:MAG: hypothetical protein LN412_02390 [Candidatus Thermoplasmatota archaeon]|nr:hypothetical protein [Candidatus Thermoplasmatota archaeon]
MVSRVKRKASLLALLSGSLLLAGHFSGAARWSIVIGIVSSFVTVTPLLRFLFLAIIWISSLGGAAVILGGLLVLEERILLAKLLILLGTGFGIVSFVIVLVLAIYRGDLPVASGPFVVMAGIGLSIAARFLMRR